MTLWWALNAKFRRLPRSLGVPPQAGREGSRETRLGAGGQGDLCHQSYEVIREEGTGACWGRKACPSLCSTQAIHDTVFIEHLLCAQSWAGCTDLGSNASSLHVVDSLADLADGRASLRHTQEAWA